MKRIIYILILVILFLIPIKVSANSIDKIEMDIYIDEFGNALITETWNAYLNQGTEGYRSYSNLGISKITNFSVEDEKQKYENIEWKESASFSEKAYKSGINYLHNKVELCWGISEYGNKTYTLKYNIENFVTQYTDTQGIYFNLINLEQPVDDVKITVHSNETFSLENSKIWGFGNNGKTIFENGNIILKDNNLSSSEYMVLLVRFEENLFNIENKSNLSFDDIYDEAMEGVEKEKTIWQKFLYLIVLIFMTIVKSSFFWFIIILYSIYYFVTKKRLIKEEEKKANLDFGPLGNKLPSDAKIEYFRDIPCEKDLFRAYWVANNFNVVSKTKLRNGIIGAILLKWIKEDKITISKEKKKKFQFKDNNYSIDFNNLYYVEDKIENSLLKILEQASGYNRILETKEFRKWCKKNSNQVRDLFTNFNKLKQEELENSGLIYKYEKTTKRKTIYVKKVNPVLRNEAIQLKGLKKFLLDFSKISGREYFEVHLWEDYLIYAQLLGIADKVEEQFSKLYPDFKIKTNLKLDFTNDVINNISHSSDVGYRKGIRKKVFTRVFSADSSGGRYSGNSRSSGSGGRSYSSGGSSARGSSGGGFR